MALDTGQPPGARPLRVLVAHDRSLVRGALTALLERDGDITVVAEATTADEARPGALEPAPHVVVLDVSDSDGDPLPIARQICVAAPSVRVLLILSENQHGVFARIDQRELSRVGLITVAATSGHLLSAVRSLAEGRPVIDPELVASLLSAPGNPLTRRERMVLQLAAQGLPVKEIAGRLFLSLGTVRNCLSRINGKTGARNRIQAILFARQAGWF